MSRILKAGAVAVAAVAIFAAAPSRARADRDDYGSGSFFLRVAADGFRATFASYDRCEPPRRWIAGHFECRRDQVCIPGYWQTVETPAQYGWVRHGCHWNYVIVRPACTNRVWVPGRHEWQETKVWIPGHFDTANAYARAY